MYAIYANEFQAPELHAAIDNHIDAQRPRRRQFKCIPNPRAWIPTLRPRGRHKSLLWQRRPRRPCCSYPCSSSPSSSAPCSASREDIFAHGSGTCNRTIPRTRICLKPASPPTLTPFHLPAPLTLPPLSRPFKKHRTWSLKITRFTQDRPSRCRIA